jgi:hypothetical protein
MSQYLSLSVKDKKLVVSEFQECCCNLKGSILKVDRNDKVALINPKKVENYDCLYLFLVIWRIGKKNWQIKFHTKELSDCYCKFHLQNLDKIDTVCKEIEIILKVNPKNEIDIINIV